MGVRGSRKTRLRDLGAGLGSGEWEMVLLNQGFHTALNVIISASELLGVAGEAGLPSSGEQPVHGHTHVEQARPAHQKSPEHI